MSRNTYFYINDVDVSDTIFLGVGNYNSSGSGLPDEMFFYEWSSFMTWFKEFREHIIKTYHNDESYFDEEWYQQILSNIEKIKTDDDVVIRVECW